MKLQRIGAAVAERLHLEQVALGQQLGARRQVEALAVPLIDLFRPGIDDGKTRIGRPDRVIADLGMTLRMRENLAAQRPGAHLRAEADAEERLVLLERNRDPVDLAADEIVGVVGAHRPAENHRAGMLRQARRQRIAEPRPAHVELVAELRQGTADTARRGMLLVQDDQNRLWHDRGI